MEGVPAGRAFGEQVCRGQPVEAAPRLDRGDVGERGRGGGGELTSGYESEQPEHPPVIRVEAPVGQVEGGAQGGRVVAVDAEGVEQVAAAELLDVRRDGVLRVVGEEPRGDAESERMPRRELGEVGDDVRLGGRPAGAEEAFEQLDGFVPVERVERQALCAVLGDESGQPIATGDEGEAGGGSGQQRTDLVCRRGIVEDDQDPSAGEGRAVGGGGAVHVGGDRVRLDAEAAKEVCERLDRPERGPRGIPAQIEVELAVGEPFGHGVGPAHREGRLADAAHPAQHDQAGRPGGSGRFGRLCRHGGGHQLVELFELGTATGEARDRGRQLGGHRTRRRLGAGRHRVRAAARTIRRGQPRIVAEQGELEVLELAAGIDAELLHEVGPGGAGHLQCPRGLSAAVPREHQLTDEPLSGRVDADEAGELVDDRRVTAEAELGVDAVLDGDHAGLFEAVAQLVADRRGRRAGQWLSGPEGECLREQLDGPLVEVLVDGGAGAREQVAEPVHVDTTGIDLDPVSVPVADERNARAESRPQSGDADLDGVPGTARRLTRPEQLDQPRGRHHAVGLQQQCSEDEPLLAWAEVQQLPVDTCLDGSEQAKVHGQTPPCARSD